MAIIYTVTTGKLGQTQNVQMVPPPRASCVRLTKKIFYQKMRKNMLIGGPQSPFFDIFLIG